MPNKAVRFMAFSATGEFHFGEDVNKICWYTSSELRRMRYRAVPIVLSFRNQGNNRQQQLASSPSPEELITMHGVEILVRRDIFQNAQNLRIAHLNAIMSEQRRQERLQRPDVDALADASRCHLGKSKETAWSIGIKHYVERE